jgi:hypothetical protein
MVNEIHDKESENTLLARLTRLIKRSGIPEQSVFQAFTMKLDPTDVRYVTSEEFRVLTAVW